MVTKFSILARPSDLVETPKTSCFLSSGNISSGKLLILSTTSLGIAGSFRASADMSNAFFVKLSAVPIVPSV